MSSTQNQLKGRLRKIGIMSTIRCLVNTVFDVKKNGIDLYLRTESTFSLHTTISYSNMCFS